MPEIFTFQDNGEQVMSSILKELLRQKGYTTAAFAEKSGISKRTLDPYVSGARSFENTPVWLAVKIADTLDVDIHELMKGEIR